MASLSVNKARHMIDGPVGKLEVAVEPGADSGSLADQGYYAVVCHPHPLFGGEMDNKVVTTVARIYRELGVSTARFNFRGVGGSEGEHDNARGEVDDLQAVAAWLQQHTSGTHLLLAGYSFGSMVAAAGSLSMNPEHLILVAPPVERYTYAPEGQFTCPAALALGEDDDLVDAQNAKAWAEQLTSPVEILLIAGASHFFHGQLLELSRQLSPALLKALL
ncbi:MAG: hypothetical protein KUG71_07650 [Porticoccaceae bacterium]|nr:hypothetical protein [Porticoccaceae bacterium]